MGYTLLIDNYDSFTWNIYADIATLGGNPLVRRNDKITIQDMEVGSARPLPAIMLTAPGDVRRWRPRSDMHLARPRTPPDRLGNQSRGDHLGYRQGAHPRCVHGA